MFLIFSAPSASAWNEPGRYQIIDLWDIGFGGPPNPDLNGTMGINNLGEVVYGKRVGDYIHAFLYLPESNYGFGAGTVDIHIAADLNSEVDSIARDINDRGEVAGQVGGYADGSGHAIMWRLGAYYDPVTTFTLGLLGSGTWSSGHAINNDDPPVVVGTANRILTTDHCPCGIVAGTGTANFRRAFKAIPDTSLAITELELPTDKDYDSFGRDVMTKEESLDPLKTAGYWNCNLDNSGIACSAFPDPCTKVFTAAQWEGASTFNILDDFASDKSSRAYGTNDTGELVGSGELLDGESNCLRVATYWASSGDAPIELPHEESAGVNARAFAINNRTLRQAIGQDITHDTGFLWEQVSEGDWGSTFVDLDNLNYPGNYNSTCGIEWRIVQAHDINDSDHLAVIGRSSGGAYHAFVLVPFASMQTNTCRPDTNQDEIVDVSDLLVVINGWGTCVPFTECPGDATCDHEVNIDDILRVIGFWGTNGCNVVKEYIWEDIETCWERYYDDPEALANCLGL